MSLTDLPMVILTQIPTRTRLADTRALMQRVQAVAEQDWEREVILEATLRSLILPAENGWSADPTEEETGEDWTLCEP